MSSFRRKLQLPPEWHHVEIEDMSLLDHKPIYVHVFFHCLKQCESTVRSDVTGSYINVALLYKRGPNCVTQGLHVEYWCRCNRVQQSSLACLWAGLLTKEGATKSMESFLSLSDARELYSEHARSVTAHCVRRSSMWWYGLPRMSTGKHSMNLSSMYVKSRHVVQQYNIVSQATPSN